MLERNQSSPGTRAGIGADAVAGSTLAGGSCGGMGDSTGFCEFSDASAGTTFVIASWRAAILSGEKPANRFATTTGAAVMASTTGAGEGVAATASFRSGSAKES